LANLIVAEALATIGHIPQRCGWRWLDEVLNNQERKQVYAHYKRQAQDLGLAIFTVDHHPDALAMADQVLVAEKDAEGFTSYHWE
jgi:uncharacterized protein (DUF305 family)